LNIMNRMAKMITPVRMFKQKEIPNASMPPKTDQVEEVKKPSESMQRAVLNLQSVNKMIGLRSL